MDTTIVNKLEHQILTYVKEQVITATVPAIHSIYTEHYDGSDSIQELVIATMNVKLDEMLAAIPRVVVKAPSPVVAPRPMTAAVAIQPTPAVVVQAAALPTKTLCAALTTKGAPCKNMGKHYDSHGRWVCHSHWDTKPTAVATVPTVPGMVGVPPMVAPNPGARPMVPQKSSSSFTDIISAQKTVTPTPSEQFSNAVTVNLDDIGVADGDF